MSPIDVAKPKWWSVADILRKYVLDRDVSAFDSRAKRTARTYPDLDLAIITAAPLPFFISTLAEDFSESDLPFRVDILDWASAQGDFRCIVDLDKVVVQPPPNQPVGASNATEQERA